MGTKSVCLVVLGDIGRSPRMQYHARSFLQHNYNVDFIGYVESEPLHELRIDPRAKLYPLTQFPDLNLPNAVKYFFKTLWQILSLFIALASVRKPEIVLCQNPPGIPTLFVCYFYCWIVRSKFIIDWHNYTYTILTLSLSPTHLIVRIAKRIESYFGRKSTANFCVTKAMKDDLAMNWSIAATVLYDRPPINFQPITIEQIHELYCKLGQEYEEFLASEPLKENQLTAFTEVDSDGVVRLRNRRPGIIVSSTSWTPDEDFSILLNALERYEIASCALADEYPNLLCIITGKGPEKEHYVQEIAKKTWSKVRIITPWLHADDYPLLLASADLGVCLHYSSSGLDLPMKVVDMFGCGLPVAAINFQCLNELVVHGKNGFVFNDSEELSEQLLSWFHDFPNNLALVNTKETFQRTLRQFQKLRWDANWNAIALPIIKM